LIADPTSQALNDQLVVEGLELLVVRVAHRSPFVVGGPQPASRA